MREGWKLVRLGEVTKITRDRIDPRELEASHELIHYSIPALDATGGPEAARAGSIKSHKFKVETDGVAISMLNPRIPRSVLINGSNSTVCSTEFAVLRPSTNELSIAYLNLVAMWPEFNGYLSRSAKGTTGSRKRSNAADVSAFKVLLPPLPEQHRIVDLIGSLDEAIEAADDATSAISHLLLAAREAIPAGEEIALGELLEGIDSGVSVVTPNELATELEPQVLKLSAVKPGFFVPEEAKALSGAFLPERARLHEGDLLMTRANTPDRVGYVCVARGVRPESYMPDLVWRLLVDTSFVSVDFLEQVLSSTEIRRRVTATATGTSSSMKKISKAKVATVLIPVPLADEQAAYVRLTQAIESERSACEDYAASLRHLRTNLLTALLSGTHEIPVSYDDQLPEAV